MKSKVKRKRISRQYIDLARFGQPVRARPSRRKMAFAGEGVAVGSCTEISQSTESRAVFGRSLVQSSEAGDGLNLAKWERPS